MKIFLWLSPRRKFLPKVKTKFKENGDLFASLKGPCDHFINSFFASSVILQLSRIGPFALILTICTKTSRYIHNFFFVWHIHTAKHFQIYISIHMYVCINQPLLLRLYNYILTSLVIFYTACIFNFSTRLHCCVFPLSTFRFPV